MYSTHNHFESLYDTANNLKAMLLSYINAGFTKVAVTDHGEATTYEDLKEILHKLQDGEIDKQKKDANYKPDERIMNFELVFGVEGYLDDGINDNKNSHLILIAKDYEGYQNLCKVITESNCNKNSHGQPIITMDSLKENISTGHVFCTSACIGGPFGHIFGLDEVEIKDKLENLNNKITTLTAEIREDEINLDEENDTKEKKKARTQKKTNLKATETKKQNLEEELAVIEEKKGEREEVAKNLLNEFTAIFGKHNFFFEIQNHFINKESIVYNEIIRFALKNHPQFIAANDVHIGITRDNPNFDMMIKGRSVSKSRRFKQYQPDNPDDSEYYIKTDDEVKDALLRLNDGQPYIFKDKPISLENIVKNAISNTKILNVCNIDFPDKSYYPKFNKDWTEEQTKEYFLSEIDKGIKKLFPHGYPSPEYEERLQHEIDVISTMGYIDYLLIVQEYNQYAKSLGQYVVGPGRGSGAGSLLCYALGITELDPIKYGLLFERFLNVERVSMPDIDMDFANFIRDKVIDHVAERYGKKNTCRIVTKSYSKAKGSLREIARYLGRIDAFNEGVKPDGPRAKELTRPYYEIADKLCKQIAEMQGKDEELFSTIENEYRDAEDVDDDSKTQADILEEDNSLDIIGDNETDTQKIISIAKGINGLFMGYGMHACGAIISSDPIDSIIPLRMSDTGFLETSCTYPQAEAKGLLKMDFLGLMTLDILNDCIKRTGDTTLANIITANKAIEDKQMIQNIFDKGLTAGVFQFASPGMIRMLTDFRPDCFEDLILLVAAYRPGPLQYLKNIIEVKKFRDGRSKEKPTPAIDIKCKELEEIINPTYGAIIYQEQVMQIFQALAGYSLGQADLVRRAMGKKKEEYLAHEKEAFIHGDESRNILGCCKKVGLSEKDADNLFEQMREFAKYAFNKSHAAAYAKLSAFTAYMMDRHPQEYIISFLNFTDKEDKRTEVLKEASKHGITILPPTIDHGFTQFEAVGNNKIRFGSGFIKGMSFDDISYPDNIEDLFLMGLSEAKINAIVKLGLIKELWHDNDYRIYNGHIDNHFNEIFEEAKPLFTKLLDRKEKIAEYENLLITEPLTEKQRIQKEKKLQEYKNEYAELEENIDDLKTSAFEHCINPYTPEEILNKRTAEYESLGNPFTGIEDSLKLLENTPEIDKKLYDTEDAKLINVCATVISVSDELYTKKGNAYRKVNLMLKDGRIIERRFEKFPTALNGQFQIYSEKGIFFITSGIAKPFPPMKPKEIINSLFNVNNGVILNFINCQESNPWASKIIESKDLLSDKDININENIKLISISPDKEHDCIFHMINNAIQYSNRPVVVPFSPALYRKTENMDLNKYDNLFFVDAKTGKFYDMNMNERKDILVVKENLDARQR